MLEGLQQVEKKATASKWNRMLSHPYRYFDAIFFREFVYNKTKQSKAVMGQTFFGQKMHLLLPSSTDIYLTGGKSHHSEIRLARYIIQELEMGDIFIDVGAHYGYFSLLAANLIGASGRVIAFEASPTTFRILEKNLAALSNTSAYHQAISDTAETLTFYEFPNLYSEYNSLDITQFEKENWFQDAPPQKVDVAAIPLGKYLGTQSIIPKMIKIDVEGGEFKVIRGLKSFLKIHHPIITMEYLSEKRGNQAHANACDLLKQLGYQGFIINEKGRLDTVNDLNQSINKRDLESDNVVFKKV